MRIADLAGRRVLILGVGVEGCATYRALRAALPDQRLGLADRLPPEELPEGIASTVALDPVATLYSGRDHLDALDEFDVVVKAPGIPASLPALQRAAARGVAFTSHTALFLAECPGTVVGITGTKGKSTTASLIHTLLRADGRDVHLVGNIGTPPLALLPDAERESIFVFEMSSYQLEGLSQSPQIAVVLGIVPDHLAYHGSFDAYVAAKRTITTFQKRHDTVIYDADSPTSSALAEGSLARVIAFSRHKQLPSGVFVDGGALVFRADDGVAEKLLQREDVGLAGDFNLSNVLAALAVGRTLGVSSETMREAMRSFEPLEHRFERVGTYRDVTFYNAALSTVPEVTIAHLEALGPRVQTALLGGYDRNLDFTALGRELVERGVRTLILFPTTGERIWRAVEAIAGAVDRPRAFFVSDMEQAVRLAYEHTPAGAICLHSPASPSFGVFRDYRERGTLFKDCVRRLGSE